jgi:hypothetical protein
MQHQERAAGSDRAVAGLLTLSKNSDDQHRASYLRCRPCSNADILGDLIYIPCRVCASNALQAVRVVML